MKKLFKSRKAISPVAAAIILIAVTVAVSIAVAAFMGGFNSQKAGKSENIQIEKLTFGGMSGGPNNVIAILIKDLDPNVNTVTIAEVRVNKITKPFSGTSTLTTYSEQSLLIIYNVGWVSENKYEVELITSNDNVFSREDIAS